MGSPPDSAAVMVQFEGTVVGFLFRNIEKRFWSLVEPQILYHSIMQKEYIPARNKAFSSGILTRALFSVIVSICG